MATNNAEYWRERFIQLEEATHERGASFLPTVDEQFAKAQKEIQEKIAVWYQRFADNNQVSMSEAQKMLSSSELKELKWDIEEYIKYGKENAINQQWLKQLENASTKYHITRLQSLNLQMQQSIEKLYGNQLDDIDNLMRNIYEDGYYHTAFEIQKGTSIGKPIAAINDNQLSAIISKPWAADGKNFSDRIWANKGLLISELHTQLTQNCILGKSPDEAIKTISKRMNVSKSNASNIVMTESAYFGSVAQKDCFKELDVERYELVATLDSHTSPICRRLDGKVFDMSVYEPGVTAPPFHCYCRTVTAPYFDDNEGERAARGADGKTCYVPSDMKYDEWHEKFVESDPKYVAKEKANKNANSDKKQYENFKKVLGKDVPNSFDKFQNLKYNSSEKWRFVKLDYQRQNELIKNSSLKLPNADRATIADAKFTGYLFNPSNPRGYAKGQAITSRLGYDINNWSELQQSILNSAKKYPSNFIQNNGYGDKYEQKIILYGLNDKPANVIVGWIVNGTETRMSSVYIKEVK